MPDNTAELFGAAGALAGGGGNNPAKGEAPMMAQAREVLRRVFGYGDFIGRQAEVIGEVINGRDALAIMPTGGGKSLCYQIPAIVRPGVGIVVSPLIALMKDQVDALLQNQVRAAFLNSAQTPKQSDEVCARFVGGELDLLYVSPERLLTPQCLQMLRAARIALFAIDEAHCISQWGHDFRREYLQLGQLAGEFPNAPRLALTATADARTRGEIIGKLRLHNAAEIVASFDRANIRYAIRPKTPGGARAQFLDFYRKNHNGDSGIVYCMSRRKTEETAAALEKEGIRAMPYHAGMPKADRERSQECFAREEGIVICATIAFGMGIDKPDVRFVAHFDLPKNVEGYYQETGRAGRDGLAANAVLYFGMGDVFFVRQLIDESAAPEHVKNAERDKLNAMINICETGGCRRAAILAVFGEHYNPPCNNCDNCQSPPQKWDATTAAQKFLSCIARTGQRYGAGYVVDVLRGSGEKLKREQHRELSVFGIGKDMTKPQWNSLARQLVAGDKLSVSGGEYKVLSLNEESWKIMRGQEKVFLRKDPPRRERAERGERKNAKATTAILNELTGEQMAVFDVLRAERRRLAIAQNIPAYVIFHDATLLAMAQNPPQNEAEFAALPGVGAAKVSRYCRYFLRALNNGGKDNKASGGGKKAGVEKTKAKSSAGGAGGV